MYGSPLQYADYNLKNKKDFILKAVTKNGLALAHASSILQEDEEVVLAAITKNPLAFAYAPLTLKNNREFMRKVFNIIPLRTYNLGSKR